ncbi:MAG: PIN domain-containing protein [Thermoflexales bacterium]|nr:PIN domain-containing protein [Thermoflexales bacterium]
MIVPDANLLLYAYNASAREHGRAQAWWEEALSSEEAVGLSWQTLTAFIRVGTNPRAFPHPLSIAEAVDVVTSWLEQPNAQIITPSARHWPIYRQLLLEAQAAGPLAMDAHLAALAIEHGATLCTHDADFKRFDRLRVYDPIAD